MRGPSQSCLTCVLYESLRSRRRRIRPVVRSASPSMTVTSSDTPVKGRVCAPATAPAAEPVVSPATLFAGGSCDGVLSGYWAAGRRLVHVDAQLVVDDGLLDDRVRRACPGGGIAEPAERGEHPEDHGRGRAGKGEARPGCAADRARRVDLIREALYELFARFRPIGSSGSPPDQTGRETFDGSTFRFLPFYSCLQTIKALHLHIPH